MVRLKVLCLIYHPLFLFLEKNIECDYDILQGSCSPVTNRYGKTVAIPCADAGYPGSCGWPNVNNYYEAGALLCADICSVDDQCQAFKYQPSGGWCDFYVGSQTSGPSGFGFWTGDPGPVTGADGWDMGLCFIKGIVLKKMFFLCESDCAISMISWRFQCLGITPYPLSVQKLLHLPGTKTGSLDVVFSDLDNFTAVS